MAKSKPAAMAATDYKPAHERPNGPWDDYDKDEGLRTLSKAHKIRKNKGFMGALKEHAKKQLAMAQATHNNLQGEPKS